MQFLSLNSDSIEDDDRIKLFATIIVNLQKHKYIYSMSSNTQYQSSYWCEQTIGLATAIIFAK